LASLTSAAGVIAVKRIFKGLLSGTFDGSEEPTKEIVQEPEDTVLPEAQTEKSVKYPMAADDVEMVPSDARTTQNSTIEADETTATGPSSLTTLLRSTPLTPAQLSKLTITLSDFLAALETTQPSATREGFTTRPDISWSDIGALKGIREELEMAIVWPIRRYALAYIEIIFYNDSHLR
jgi:ribosome biogenesis ATPase